MSYKRIVDIMSQTILSVFYVSSIIGCGVIGPPIAPEEVGIEAKIRKQEEAAQNQESLTEEPVPLDEEPVELPPLRPIGTR